MTHKIPHRWTSIGMVALLAACSGEPAAPIRPDVAAERSANADSEKQPDLSFIAKFKTKPAPPDPQQDHALIGPEGGSLRVGDFEIIVPAGAVDRRTNFRIRIPTDPRESNFAFAEFSPHMEFNKPVIIRLPAAATTVDGQPYVMWWTGSFWQAFDTQPTSDGRIETQTSHFSYYGASYWAKGVILVGG